MLDNLSKTRKRLDEIEAMLSPPSCDWGHIYDLLFEMEIATAPNLHGSALTMEQFEQRPDGQGGVMGTREDFIQRKTIEFARKNDAHFKG